MSILPDKQLFITILIIAAGTILTRFLPFIVFLPGKPIPLFIKRLQVLLPGAAIGALVVYSLKDVNLLANQHGIPEFLAIILIVSLHRMFNKGLLSIAGGTAFYILLVHFVFS